MYIIKHVLECAYNNKYCTYTAYYTDILYILYSFCYQEYTHLLNFSHWNILSLSSSDEN